VINPARPPVPELHDEWISVRREHLMSEIERPTARVSRRLVASAFGGIAIVSATVIAVLAGITAPVAFAGWTASPTRPATGQLQAAETACARPADPTGRAPTLTDTRGPYTLLLFAASGASTICISGPSVISIVGGGQATSRPGARAITVTAFGIGSTSQGRYTDVVGEVGPGVAGVTLIRDDGSTVRATTVNGWFAAWWPGKQGTRAVYVTSDRGSVRQTLDLPVVPHRVHKHGAIAAQVKSPRWPVAHSNLMVATALTLSHASATLPNSAKYLQHDAHGA
jgi:hypothetical protein